VRYTSDTAESTFGDVKGDIPPELMRVVGALPERMLLLGDRLLVTMQASNLVQEWRIDPDAADAADMLVPVATHPTGYQPIGIAAGPAGTPAADLVFTANFMGGSISVIDRRRGTAREIAVDPSVERLPFPATNAERGEFLAHSALFSSDGDTSCFHCHYLDMGDGRPWGVSQVASQEYLSPHDDAGQLVIGGTMGVPQMRGLQAIQPFFFEGVLSAFEPRSMLMEHCPADDFQRPTPQGDFRAIRAHYRLDGISDVQSGMDTTQNFDADLEERRDEMFRRVSMQHLGKAYTLRDFQRFVGEWQINQPRLLPVPFDQGSASVKRGELLFADPRVGCISCHAPPAFARKDFAGNPQQALPPQVTTTVRDGAFTLIGMNRLDAINGYRRDLEPWDAGRVEAQQAHYTTFPLRGLWDRPPVFLHHGMARSLREVIAVPGHASLRSFRCEVLLGGVPERPGRREVGCNTTYFVAGPTRGTRLHVQVGGRIGIDTHGGTSQLTAQQVDDLVAYLETIE
jgi:mono/diheme cytochrome c family protein